MAKFDSIIQSHIESDPSRHLDTVQNFRLWFDNLPLQQKKELLGSLRTPDGNTTLREELVEWRGMIRWLSSEL